MLHRVLTTHKLNEILGRYLTLNQLHTYRDAESLKIAEDAQTREADEEDSAELDRGELFKDSYFYLMQDIYIGIIRSGDVKKFLNFQSLSRTTATPGLDESFQAIQLELEDGTQLRSELVRTALSEDNSWDILAEYRDTIANEDEILSDLYRTAVQSTDIAHYLLVKALRGPVPRDYSYDIAWTMLCCTPQNISFYYAEFPEVVEKLIQEFIHGDIRLFFYVSYTPATRKFMRLLMEYVEWTPEVYQRIQQHEKRLSRVGVDDTTKMLRYLGL
jgi:hypothetical protein